jgi:REP element-mobilizing transposase RayT
VARQERAQILELGMVTTHLHILARLHPMAQIPRLLQRWKGGSSAVAAKELGFPRDRLLRWAPGYTVHSVSLQAIEKVAEYVRSQNLRHPSEVIAGWNPAAIHSAGARGRDNWEVVVA